MSTSCHWTYLRLQKCPYIFHMHSDVAIWSHSWFMSFAFMHCVFIFCIKIPTMTTTTTPTTTMTIIIKCNHIMELTRCEMFVFLIWSHLVLWLNWYNTMKRVEMVCKSEKLQRYYAPTLQYSLPIFRDNITCHWLWH